jgi:hypothetical protein
MKQHLSRILGALVTLLRVFFSWDECEHLHPVAKCVVSSKSKFYRIGKEQFSGWRCARWFGYARERTSIAQPFCLTNAYLPYAHWNRGLGHLLRKRHCLSRTPRCQTLPVHSHRPKITLSRHKQHQEESATAAKSRLVGR